ncbi:argininosuccinate lyase [Legionella jordanis]|uniref:Argininosuccinate lyase n=1 Tax=Legionella jordanis TaxID=456 RepID=A0A0W0VEV4_9GAMM|nr:argininosuccinate lyase [Legionella jordanis]KTD18634.1 argininosuccinate lyase [Legionella jordanis]RMX00856.1 argininosuccinate lyase [Legionella jordanis]VEH11510.1 argininosuccinate lyase [Legionella jordanis]
MTSKTWGGRFKKAIDERVAQFNASLSFDFLLFPYDIAGSKAHARMLAKQGLLTVVEAKQIEEALTEIEMELKEGQHVLDNSCEDVHMFIEQLLINKLGEVGKKLHTGRSRNDQVALDLRLYSREAGQQIEELLRQLIATLNRLAEQHQNDRLPGYTHLQPAQPIYLGWFFKAYLSMFQRDMSRFEDWHKRMNFSPLGAGALAGSNLPLDRHWVAEQLGFQGIIDNTIDAVSDRDFVIEFCSVAAIIMMHLSRLCEDLILWASEEFHFVELDDAFATGSSLMPNKKNPDVLELIRGKTGRVYGHLAAILTVMKALPLSYNKDMQEDKEILFDKVNTLKACLSIIRPFLENLHFNTTAMEERANSGYLEATHVLEELVLQGVPFRDAHHLVGQWVKQAIDEQCSLAEIIQQQNNHLNLDSKD